MLFKIYYSVYSQKQWKFHYTKSIYLNKLKGQEPAGELKSSLFVFQNSKGQNDVS